ncbi:MAG: helix-turn-helix transcriptional regulator [Chitinophagaceae bacterium]|nr:helix-turn-helix transcriptional regulator [Chitinophagaceae bacterium]
MNKKNKISHCPVDYAFQRIGGKYKGRILWVLKDGILRYGELKRAIIGITPKMLTQTLKELEEDGLHHCEVITWMCSAVTWHLQ